VRGAERNDTKGDVAADSGVNRLRLFRESNGSLRLSQGLLALEFARGEAIDKPRVAWACEREVNAVKQ